MRQQKQRRNRGRTALGQNISLGHQACGGGSGTCEGNVAARGAVGLATTVTCVIVGTPVMTPTGAVVVAWVAPRAVWMAYAMTAHSTSIVSGGMCQIQRYGAACTH